MTGQPVLPASYQAHFDALLEVASAASEASVPLVPFWPLRGQGYVGDLLVIGRSVNGWIEDWTAAQLSDPAVRARALRELRADAERTDIDRMRWVLDMWGNVNGYSTRRSAFWRLLADLTSGLGDPNWPGRLVWSNLYKIAPAAGWNPGGDLQRAQRVEAVKMLRAEVDTFAPRRVLALTGTWIRPFLAGLDLDPTWHDGYVIGTAIRAATPWVIAHHPMTRPRAPFVAEVRAAFEQLGSRLP